jgi:hypothetical protein
LHLATVRRSPFPRLTMTHFVFSMFTASFTASFRAHRER